MGTFRFRAGTPFLLLKLVVAVQFLNGLDERCVCGGENVYNIFVFVFFLA